MIGTIWHIFHALSVMTTVLATGSSLYNGLAVRFLVRSGIRRIQIYKNKCLSGLKRVKHATKKPC